MKTKISCSQGFLLVEVMASLLVVTGGLLLIVHSYGSSKTVYQRSGDVLEATMLIDNQLAKMEDQGAVESVDQDGGMGEGGHYILKVQPETMPDSDLVSVTASVADRQESAIMQVVTYLKETL